MWPFLTLLLLVMGGYVYLTAYVIISDIHGTLPPEKKIWLPILAFGFIGGIVLLRLWFAAIRQLLFQKGAALWINGTAVVFLTPWYFSVDCEDIISLSETTYGPLGAKGVAVRTRNGVAKVVPLGPLAESSAVIMRKLQDELKL